MIKVKKKNGFYIIEALIALLVFMVGVLGVLQIQLNSVEATADAQYRVQAAYMAENIVSSILLDKGNLDSYLDGTNEVYGEWLNTLTGTLPGVGDNPPTITTSTVGGKTILIVTINWKSPNSSLISNYELQNVLL